MVDVALPSKKRLLALSLFQFSESLSRMNFFGQAEKILKVELHVESNQKIRKLPVVLHT